jgi:hypothetical protein
LVFGTGSGISKHGTNADEAVLMSEADMPNTQVLVRATLTQQI